MFKILHTADSHFKRDRLDECIFNSMYIVDYATQTTPDLIVHAGDLLDRNTVVNSEEYLAAVDFIEDLSAIAPVLLVRGNHDPEGSFKVFNKFPNVYAFEKLDIFSFNQIDNIEYPYPVKVAVIPYQKTTSVSGETVSKAHVSVADQLKEHLINFDKEKNEKGLKLVVAHVSVSGAELAYFR